MSKAVEQASLRQQASTHARGVLKWAKMFFTPLAIGFLLFFGWHARDSLQIIFENARPGYLAMAVLLWVLLQFFSPLIPTLIFRTCGSDISYRCALRIHAQRLPGRYLPGGFWHTVGRAIDFHDYGIRSRHLATCMFLETSFPAIITFILGGIGLGVYRDFDEWGAIGLVSAVAALIGLVIMPLLINNRFLKAPDRLSLVVFSKTVVVMILYWIVAAVAFTLYLAAFPVAMSGTSFIEVGATYLFSWGVGYIAIFAPQGIGVFEFVAGDILSAPISIGGIAVLVAGFRAVILVSDGFMWCLSRLL